VRNWLRTNFPPSLRGLAPQINASEARERHEGADYRRWVRAVGEKGWGLPTWAVEYGGAGLAAEEAGVLAQEFARVWAFNPIAGFGVMMLGPTILEFGTEAQKLRHLPSIARGEIRWCQAFSELGSGSDLASHQARCEDKGDYWLVTGRKIWTSFAHLADWCLCLVYTDTMRKRGGVTFLLVDMRTPGVEARPLTRSNGASHFCELFLSDVKVPKRETLGEVNAGWTVAKRLLQHERNGLSYQRQAPLNLAPLLLGSPQEALERTINRLKLGEQPDLRTASSQTSEDHAADLTEEIERANHTASSALAALDSGAACPGGPPHRADLRQSPSCDGSEQRQRPTRTDSRDRAARLVRAGGQGYASPSIIDRRRRILTTARKLIASDGVAAVNMAEISRHADVAKRTLYNVFQRKERLIAEAIQQYFEDYEAGLVYSTPTATAARMAEHLALIVHRNLSIRNYTRALLNVYYSSDVEQNVRRTIGEIVAHSHRPWIDRLHAERQLQPWIDRGGLVDDLTRYRYAVANDWAHGRIADDDFPSILINGVISMVIGATKPRARRECEDVLKHLDRVAGPRPAPGRAHKPKSRPDKAHGRSPPWPQRSG